MEHGIGKKGSFHIKLNVELMLIISPPFSVAFCSWHTVLIDLLK